MNQNSSKTALVAAISLAALGSTAAKSASLEAFVYHSLWHCQAFGDPQCANNQVPPGLDDHDGQGNASPGRNSAVSASHSYFDPRIGTADTGSGEAFASFGVLRTAASVSLNSSPAVGSNQPNLTKLNISSWATFSDSMTIMPVDPLLMGQAGTYSASMLVHGFFNVSSVNASATPYTVSYVDWRMRIGSGSRIFGSTTDVLSGFSGYLILSGDGRTFPGGGAVSTVSFSAPFIFGTPFDIKAAFQSDALAALGSASAKPLNLGLTTAAAQSLYENTVTWNGIQSVHAGSATITQFSALTTLGVNFASPITAAVPEPQTTWLFAAGLALVALRGAAKRQADTFHG